LILTVSRIINTVLTLFPERVLAIEKIINSKMTEFELEEEKIIKILTQVQVMKREAELQLQKQHFGEKKKINRMKKGNIDKKEKFKRKKQN
jgi:ATP-dependent RNA helicase DDX49/DBP8